MIRARRIAPLVAVTAVFAALTAAGPAAAMVLTAKMTGKVEVPKADPNGTGTPRLKTNSAKGRVCFNIHLSKVGTVVAGHIHIGGKGTAGGIVVQLFDKAT